jgi:hypothetical protein
MARRRFLGLSIEDRMRPVIDDGGTPSVFRVPASSVGSPEGTSGIFGITGTPAPAEGTSGMFGTVGVGPAGWSNANYGSSIMPAYRTLPGEAFNDVVIPIRPHLVTEGGALASGGTSSLAYSSVLQGGPAYVPVSLPRGGTPEGTSGLFGVMGTPAPAEGTSGMFGTNGAAPVGWDLNNYPGTLGTAARRYLVNIRTGGPAILPASSVGGTPSNASTAIGGNGGSPAGGTGTGTDQGGGTGTGTSGTGTGTSDAGTAPASSSNTMLLIGGAALVLLMLGSKGKK